VREGGEEKKKKKKKKRRRGGEKDEKPENRGLPISLLASLLPTILCAG